MLQAYSALDLATLDVDGPLPAREEPGRKNRSRRIDQLNALVGNPLGSPYCAAGVSTAFFDAARFGSKGLTFPYSGGSQFLKNWFNERHLMTHEAAEIAGWKGAIAGWTDLGDPEHGHVFFVAERLTSSSGHIISLGTLEYNTSPQTKGRDGEGAFRLVRPIGERQLWFCDVSLFAGGQWWTKAAA